MLIAVADRVFLRTPMSGAEYGECDSASDFSACPVTPRLLGRGSNEFVASGSESLRAEAAVEHASGLSASGPKRN